MALEFITNLIGTSPKVWSTTTATAANQIQARMAASNEVRIFVDSSINFGHQSASVLLMKRLVDSFGFTGPGKTVTMTYPAAGENETLRKLALLLPGLDPNNPQDIDYNGATLRFMNVEALFNNGQIGQVDYGFTGGADPAGGRDAPNWFAINLKVNLFLQLQTYQRPGVQLVQNGGDNSGTPAYDLTTITALGLGFNYRAWYTPDAYWTPTAADWLYYTTSQDISANNRYHAELIQALITFMDGGADRVRLMPVYGVKHAPNQMGMQPQSILPTIISTALGGSYLDPENTPVVVVSMNNDLTDTEYASSLLVSQGGKTEIELSAIQTLEVDIENQARAVAEMKDSSDDTGLSELEKIVNQSINQTVDYQGIVDRQNEEWESRKQWLEDRNAIEGVNFISSVQRGDMGPVTVQGLNVALNDLINPAQTRPAVLFLELGSLPPLIFSYLMSRASYPNVFEGANTNNLVLNQGGCYLRMRNSHAQAYEGNVRYPQSWFSSRYNSYTRSAMESLAAADGITSALNQIQGSPTNFVPNITLTTDYLNHFYYSDNNSLRTYYTQNHNYYHNPDNDRLMLGLSYMNQIAINQNIPVEAALSTKNDTIKTCVDGPSEIGEKS